MDIVKKFGLKVKKVRLSKQMSQGDLAKKLGVGPTYISQIERGMQNVSLRGIEKIAKALNTQANELIK
jgi:transcriptional regulator with XRE-family HTH domain